MANKQVHSARRIAQDTPVRRKKKRRVICGVVLALLVCFGAGHVYGRYVHGQNNTGTISSKAFHFSSKFLNNKTYSIKPAENFTIDLNNFDLSNTGHVSEVDIAYTITITDVTELETPVDVSDKFTGLSGTIEVSELTDKVTLDTYNGAYLLEPGRTYEIKAVGDGGYVHTLTATVKIEELGTNVYKYLLETGDPEHQQLIVWTENWTGDADIDLIEAKRGKDITFDPNDGNGSTVIVTNVDHPQITDKLNFQIPATSHTYNVHNPQKVDLTADDFTVTITNLLDYRTAKTEPPPT